MSRQKLLVMVPLGGLVCRSSGGLRGWRAVWQLFYGPRRAAVLHSSIVLCRRRRQPEGLLEGGLRVQSALRHRCEDSENRLAAAIRATASSGRAAMWTLASMPLNSTS